MFFKGKNDFRMKKYKLWTYDVVFYNDDMFFSTAQFNGLFKVNMHERKVKFINTFPNDLRTERRLHSAAVRYKDEILFWPDLSHHITLYNIINNNFYSFDYPLKISEEYMTLCPLVSTGLLIGACAYAFGSRYPCIIRYNFETRQLKVYDEWVEDFKKYGFKENTSFFRLNICQTGSSIFASTFHNNVLVEFDIKTEKVIFHQMKNHIQGILQSNKDMIWLLTEKGTLDVWNKRDNSFETIDLGSDLKEMGKNLHCCANMPKEIWLFPYLYGSILVINKKDNKVKAKNLITIDEDERYVNDNLGIVWFNRVYKDKLYFMSVIENRLYCFAESGNEEFCIDILGDKAEIDKYLFQDQEMSLLLEQNQVEKGTDLLWRLTYDLDDWLDILVYAKPDKQKFKKPQVRYGEQIYEFLK